MHDLFFFYVYSLDTTHVKKELKTTRPVHILVSYQLRSQMDHKILNFTNTASHVIVEEADHFDSQGQPSFARTVQMAYL